MSVTCCRFFPERMQPFVAVLSNSMYALLVSMKVCKKVTKHYEMRAAQSPVIVTLPGTDAHDAERRRSAPAVSFIFHFHHQLSTWLSPDSGIAIVSGVTREQRQEREQTATGDTLQGGDTRMKYKIFVLYFFG